MRFRLITRYSEVHACLHAYSSVMLPFSLFQLKMPFICACRLSGKSCTQLNHQEISAHCINCGISSTDGISHLIQKGSYMLVRAF